MVWDAPLPPMVHPQWQSKPQPLQRQSLHLWWIALPPRTPRQVILRHYLRFYLKDLPEAPLPVTVRGKPYLPNLSFNWSHSQDLALLAVSGTAPIGVDLEVVRPHAYRPAIAQRFFGPRLQAALANAAEEDRLFLYAWTYYEAWVKAHGASLWQPPPLKEPYCAYRFPVGDRAVATVVSLSPEPTTLCFLQQPS